MTKQDSLKNYDFLLKKIDAFIRHYYLNQLVRNIIILLASLLSGYVLLILSEYFIYFSTSVRTFFFYTYWLTNISWSIWKIFPPLLAYYQLGNAITHEQAAIIIGNHFSDVKDKLLNTLQLKHIVAPSTEQKALIEAAITQRIKQLKPIPFTSAVQIKKNKKYLKYLIPPLLIVLFLALTFPYIITESTQRLIHHNQYFQKKAPFQFNLENKSLTVLQGDNLELKLKLTGNEIPQDIYLQEDKNTFLLEKTSTTTFKYPLKNLQKNTLFRFKAGEFYSDTYQITVTPKPTLLNMSIQLEYPTYLKRKNEEIKNSGELNVPTGTKITWHFSTQNANHIQFKINQQVKTLTPIQSNQFKLALTANNNLLYTIIPINQLTQPRDSFKYHLQVIPDEYPTIQVIEQQDSTQLKSWLFTGEISDDYGFSQLLFNYRIHNKQTKKLAFNSKAININKTLRQTNFFYAIDIAQLNIQPNETLEYEFVVYDNDGVNKPKATHSGIQTFKMPSKNEIEKKLEADAQTIKNQTEAAIKLATQIERETKKLAQDLLSKKNITYEEQKQLEQLLQKQKTLEKTIENIQQTNKQNIEENQEYHNETQEIVEKQQQIEKLFNEVLTEKTKNLLKTIDELLQQNNKEQAQEELNKMQVDNKTLKKELDRVLELYKQLEFDQKLEQTVDKLRKLAEEEKQLSEQNKNNPTQKHQEAQEKQNELTQQFNDLQKDLQDLSQKNEQLENKNDFEKGEKEQQEIKKNLDKADEKLSQKEQKKAAQEQKKAAEKMEELAKKLEEKQKKEEEKEAKTNQKELKQLLKNLLSVSFEQENVMQALRKTNINDPIFVKLAQKQRDIKDNFKMIQDSLFSLSKRVTQIESSVNKEVEKINFNINKALEFVTDRQLPRILNHQQYAMTSINNLALLINEALEQLQQQSQNNSGGGKGSKGKQSLSQLRKMQEKLSQNMQKAREELEKQSGGQKNGEKKGNEGEGGSKPGGQKKGRQSSGLSEQMAKMAQQQQMIRNALQEIEKKGEKEGNKGKLGGKSLEQLLQQMEQTETELLNKRLTQESIIRQQEIVNKLLDAEKAEREQDEDNKRESKRGIEQSTNFKTLFKEFQKRKQRELELIKTIPPSLSPYYKTKVGQYFKRLNSIK